MHLKDVMSFNKMRKLTHSVEQVILAMEGSPSVQISPDHKFIRRRQQPAEEEGELD
jgi:hypothetical protein